MRTLDEAINYLDYHAPSEETLPKYGKVNAAFQALMTQLWDTIPDGPGKTVAIRAIGAARMQVNSAIANNGN